MKMTRTILAGCLAAAAVSACSAEVTPPAAPTVQENITATKSGGARSQAVTIRAKVEKVDVANRKVSVIGHDGTRETLTVGEEVKNLPQVHKGDEVVVTYYQSAAFEVLAKGEKPGPATAAAGLATAEPGQKPGGLAAKVVTMVVEVVRLDPEKSTAVIKDETGETITVDIRNPVVFQKVKVGDKVSVTLTEALAIDVQKASTK